MSYVLECINEELKEDATPKSSGIADLLDSNPNIFSFGGGISSSNSDRASRPLTFGINGNNNNNNNIATATAATVSSSTIIDYLNDDIAQRPAGAADRSNAVTLPPLSLKLRKDLDWHKIDWSRNPFAGLFKSQLHCLNGPKCEPVSE
jgi:hypothetical protein